MIGHNELVCGACGIIFVLVFPILTYLVGKKWWTRREEIYRRKYNRAIKNSLQKSHNSEDTGN
jgi:hypothetical protein